MRNPHGNSVQENLLKVNTKWYVFAHYTRHILPGMVIIDSGRDDTIAAYDRESHKVVLVAATYEEASWVTYDLSKFNVVRSHAERWSTLVHAPSTEDKYVKKDNVAFSGKTFTVLLDANSVQTFEIKAKLQGVEDSHQPKSNGEDHCCLCQ